MKLILSLCCFLFSLVALSQSSPRSITSLNADWFFSKDFQPGALIKWQPVTLPHTWNVDDVMDDVPGYYRGIAWYKRKLVVPKKLSGKQLYLHFEGANQVAEVFINGKKAGEHTGGYSAFVVPITSLLDLNKENEILVKVDNSHNQDIPPISADFTFFGGIYRDVWLVALDDVHFSFNEDGGGGGIFITTPVVDTKNAIVHLKAGLTNNGSSAKKIRLLTSVKNRSGKTIISTSQVITLEAGANKQFVQPPINIRNPALWSPESPYLYSIVSEIRDLSTGKILDIKSHPLGLRWFHFDAAQGFFLNGKSYKLVGTSRHQDYKGLGNAVPDSLAIKDIVLLKEMGGNFLRVAHYPQDPSVLTACDSLGILASVEIPIVNEITETGNFYSNCLNMQREMIREHFNHPSVIIWCYMNEVLLRPHYNNDKEKQAVYFAAVTKLARSLDSLTRKEDPYRYTMMAHHGDYNRYQANGLVEIPMIVGWNLYSGWYGANMNDFPAFLDTFHAKHPKIPMLVSEYGADADPRIRSADPVRFDKSVEYTTRFHQFYFTEMQKRPFVAAAMIWNLADFNSETRTESMPHINNKGLLEWDRAPKDPYYYYKAVLSNKPFLKILGTPPGAAIADSNQLYSTKSIQVATNLPEVEIIVNGKSVGIRKSENGLCEVKSAFINGINSIEVKGEKGGRKFNEKALVPFTVLPRQFNNLVAIKQMNILLGANRYFTDDNNQLWIPDQLYKQGSWGHIGGKTFKIARNNRLPYGTDKNIIGTTNDPIYQTQLMGIEKYRFDLPAGDYELTLHFAELLGGQVKELPYNLADPDRIEPNGKRIFNVFVNGKLLLDNFDITAQYGSATAVAKTIRVSVSGEGLEIAFKAIEGEPVLNALQIKKVDNNQQTLQYSPGTK